MLFGGKSDNNLVRKKASAQRKAPVQKKTSVQRMGYRISGAALHSMHAALEAYPDVETGGLLLGYRTERAVVITDALWAGPDARQKKASLTLDMKYANYEAERAAALHGHAAAVCHTVRTAAVTRHEVGAADKPEIVGIWHKHNHCLNPPFSKEDHQAHRQLVKALGSSVVSVLFQKKHGTNNRYVMWVFSVPEKKVSVPSALRRQAE